LLFPLFSSVVFVFGMVLGKRAITAGSSPWTSTFLANIWLAAIWAAIGVYRGEWLPVPAWWQAAVVGLAFVAGQMFSFLAFQHGDVSVATPIFGTKVVIVALILSLVGDEPVGTRVWIGAVLASLGVALMQRGAAASPAGRSMPGSPASRSSPASPATPPGQSAASSAMKSTGRPQSGWRALATVGLALLSATSLSLFDVGVQRWAREWGANAFLPAAFVAGGLLSCVFLPWCDRPSRVRNLGVARPLLFGTFLIALQALSMSYSLGNYGDATRINIVYALRGLWAVGLAWWLARVLRTSEAHLPARVLAWRLAGAILLTASVVIAL
jgi:drug/metabolite transporter (DMT)-like permease